jgi:acyl-CoA reductase-like NAD-dependent aldehyde dehydrogenase
MALALTLALTLALALSLAWHDHGACSPMVSKEQHAKVVAAIRSAEAEGCTVITGGVQSPELEKGGMARRA